MAFPATFPTVRPYSPSRKSATSSSRRTGTLTIIHQCRTLSPAAELPTCGPAVHVIVRKELEVRKTQVWPVFLPPTLFNRWPTTRAAPKIFRPAEKPGPVDDRDSQSRHRRGGAGCGG